MTHTPSRTCHDKPDGTTNAATGITTPRTTPTVLRASRTAAATTATARAVTTFDVARSAGTQSTYRCDPMPWTTSTGSVPAARTLATTRGLCPSAPASCALGRRSARPATAPAAVSRTMPPAASRTEPPSTKRPRVALAITTAATPPSHPETADRRGSAATATASPHATTIIIEANRASCDSNASSSSPGISAVCPGPRARASAACTAVIEVAARAHATEPKAHDHCSRAHGGTATTSVHGASLPDPAPAASTDQRYACDVHHDHHRQAAPHGVRVPRHARSTLR